MTRLFRHLIVLALVLAACGGEPAITARQLARIMPSGADAPAGTTLRAEQSGPQTLDEFVTDESVRSRLRTLGFNVAYVAAFATPNFPADPRDAPAGAALYNSFAILLRDADAAREGLRFYEGRVSSRAKDRNPVLTSELGEDAIAFRFSSLDDTLLPGIAFLWRVGNALFSVVGVGNPDPNAEAARALARGIDAGAKR